MDFLHHGTLVVFVLFLFHHCCSSMRYKRDNSDHFNIMLSLFKVKPLENSKVYKTFSNTMLLPASDPIRLSDIKFDVKEFDKYFDNKHKTEHGYTEYKDSPIIQEKLKQEPIKHNIIEHSAEPRFEAVDKLEFFDERDPISAKLFTK
ncbi:hypothetical protein O0L34_g17956 [Tuta absoluta]|nr:hypothetical protein O0L34_g17956 [Tuta absoluta]